MKSKWIKDISMLDAMAYAADPSLSASHDILLVDATKLIHAEFETFRLGFMAFCYCTRGTLTVTRSGVEMTFLPGDFLIDIGEQVYENPVFSPDFQAHFLLLSTQCAQDSTMGLTQMWQYLLYLYSQPLLHLSAEERLWADRSFALVEERLRDTGHRYRRDSLIALMRVFYFDICDLLSRRQKNETPKNRSFYRIFDTFIHLLGQNYTRERSLAWYGEQMCITPKYLSEVVKEVSGRTAGQWVSDLVVMEAKKLLSATSLSIKEIAHRLNFPTQSFLGKYFKNFTGISPSEYRLRNAL